MKFELYPPSSNHMLTSSAEEPSISTIPVLGCYKIELADSSQPAAQSSGSSNPTAQPLAKNDEEADQQSSDDSSKGLAMPIDKLKVHGNQLSQQKVSPPQSPHPPSTSATVQDLSEQSSQQATISSKQHSMLRRYEFIRRSLPRSGKPSSPTFVIEGKRVSHKQSMSGEISDTFDDSKLDFDPVAYLENRMNPMKSLKPILPPKPKTDQSAKSSATSVILPVLHIDGPGYSHQFRSKSSSLPGDDQPAELEDMATEPAGQQENIWSELENLDQKSRRAIKKNNFFPSAGTRIGEDYSELCVDNSNKLNKTITLHLHTSQEKQRPATNGFTAVPNTTGYSQQLPKTSKSSRDKLYKSANHLSSTVSTRPLFHSVNSYINFNKRGGGMYHSEQYLDSTKMDGPLRPLENQLKRPFSKKLITKYSDMEIQRELNDFFKIRPVK